MISPASKVILIILAIAIVLTLFLFPAGSKPKPLRVGAKANMTAGGEQGPITLDDLEEDRMPGRPAPAPAAPKQSKAGTFLPGGDAGGMADFELLAERYGRSDPFVPLYKVPSAGAGEDVVELPEISPLPPMQLRNPPRLILSGIAIQNRRGIAVINGEILREGGEIEGYVVDMIAPDRVELHNDMGDTVVLRIKQEVKLNYDMSGSSISNMEEMRSADNKARNPAPAAGKVSVNREPLKPVTEKEVWDYYDREFPDSAAPENAPSGEVPTVSP